MLETVKLEGKQLIDFLKETARQRRLDVLKMTYLAGSGHPGGSFSSTELMTTLYYTQIRIDPKNPKWPDRDRFVLSKGHCNPILYSVLADKGFFPKAELWKLRKVGAMLQGHPDMKHTPGIEASTGSLGQGLSIANGIALAGRIDKKNYRVYTLHGDGEVQEGNFWEGAMTSAHHKLNKVTAMLDYNHVETDGTIEEIMDIAPMFDKMKAFNWNVIEIDGHDFKQILNAFKKSDESDMPTFIIAQTDKGHGVSFMEGEKGFHGRCLTDDEMRQAFKELDAKDEIEKFLTEAKK